MEKNGHSEIDLRNATAQELAQLMRRGVTDALQAHQDAGLPVVVWDRETRETLEVSPKSQELPVKTSR